MWVMITVALTSSEESGGEDEAHCESVKARQ
jgi:hypothetical protein